MNDKGSKLNERVWKLFEKAGFKTKPNSNDPSEEIIMLTPKKKRTVDLSATIVSLGVKIIGWNKARKKLRESLTVHIHDYNEVKKSAKANSVLFVSSEKEVAAEDIEYAKKLGMRVWGESELKYYEAVVDAIGEYAKYEMIHSFGIKTKEEKNIHQLLALQLHQPYSDSPANLYLFTMTPEELLKTCVIFRRAQGSGDAYQRMVRKTRLRSVKKFVTEENAILPPNIIVNLSKKVTGVPVETPATYDNGKEITLTKKNNYELVVLSIPMEYASLELIDGQHRLYGFVETEPATKNNFNLVVLGIEELPLDRRRDTFVAINDNSRRVNPNLVAYLKYTDDELECQKNPELMAIKIGVELNKTTPFKNKIRLIDMGNEKITLKGFSGYDLRGLVSSSGLLTKYYKNESKDYIAVLRLYFGVLQSLFREQWKSPEKYVIFTNIGISAFLKLLKSILKTCKCRPTNEILKQYLQPLRDKWQDADWETKTLSETLRSSYVGSKGWKDLHRLLVSTIQEKYPKFKE